MTTPVGGCTRERRARCGIGDPAPGRPLGAGFVGLLVAGGSVLLLRLGGWITQVPPLAERAGGFEGPQLRVRLDPARVLGTAVAGT